MQLTIDVDDDNVLLSNLDDWHYVLNFWHYSLTEEENNNFETAYESEGFVFQDMDNPDVSGPRIKKYRLNRSLQAGSISSISGKRIPIAAIPWIRKRFRQHSGNCERSRSLRSSIFLQSRQLSVFLQQKQEVILLQPKSEKSSEFFRFRGLLKRPLYELSILAGDHRIEL